MLAHLLVAVAAAFVLSLSSLPASAGLPANMGIGEIARLPPYCPDTQLFSKVGTPDAPTERQRRWVGMVGKAFWAMHHYCWALVNSTRAGAAGVGRQERLFLLQTAEADVLYVLENATPDFPLRPELLYKLGEFALLSEKPLQALEYLRRSQEAKPDYWPAYMGRHDVNLSLGRREGAVEALQEGLKVIPGEPHLQDALARLQRGGVASGIRSRAPHIAVR